MQDKVIAAEACLKESQCACVKKYFIAHKILFKKYWSWKEVSPQGNFFTSFFIFERFRLGEMGTLAELFLAFCPRARKNAINNLWWITDNQMRPEIVFCDKQSYVITETIFWFDNLKDLPFLPLRCVVRFERKHFITSHTSLHFKKDWRRPFEPLSSNICASYECLLSFCDGPTQQKVVAVVSLLLWGKIDLLFPSVDAGMVGFLERTQSSNSFRSFSSSNFCVKHSRCQWPHSDPTSAHVANVTAGSWTYL